MAKRSVAAKLNESSQIIQNAADVGSIIQERRKALGHTQESLAESVQINLNTLKFIEQGRRGISLQMLLKISKALSLQLKLDSK